MLARRADSPARPLRRFQQHHAHAALLQTPRAREAGNPAARNDHIRVRIAIHVPSLAAMNSADRAAPLTSIIFTFILVYATGTSLNCKWSAARTLL